MVGPFGSKRAWEKDIEECSPIDSVYKKILKFVRGYVQ